MAMAVNRRRFLAQAAATGVVAALAPRILNSQSAARKPNFIVVLCDDLGYGDIGAFGGTAIKTPAIDQMAREGTRLTNFYPAANLCTPSRAGLLTGRYAVRPGLA